MPDELAASEQHAASCREASVRQHAAPDQEAAALQYAVSHAHTVPRPGESKRYHLVSVWHIPAPASRVWAAFADLESWPRWWRGIRTVRVAKPGAEDGLGTAGTIIVGSPLGYRLRVDAIVVAVNPPREATISVSGEFRGSGRWRAEECGAVTRITMVYCVTTRRRIVRLIGHFGPWAHRWVMRAGERGLMRWLLAATDGE